MNAVIYARYSSDNQREESIEGQLRECTEYAQHNDMTILGTYVDRALSAKTADRPEFQRMVQDSGKGLFDVVIVWKLDRFSRDRYDSAHYKRILRGNGVKVVSAKENISEGPEGIILEAMLEGYAEYYSAELSQKIHRGQTENALKGKYNGGHIPLGYRVGDDRKLEIDPVTAPIIEEIFTRYAEGETVRTMIESLNRRGLKTKLGKDYNLNSFNRILKNRKYIGEYRYREVVIADGVPAIISLDLFDRVQERMEKNKRAPARSKATDEFLLTTKLFCGLCQRMMVGESGTSRNGTVHYYYKCGSAKRGTGCKKKAVRKSWMEQAVVQLTVGRVLHDQEIDRIADTLIALQDREDTTLPALKSQLSDVEKSIENMLTAIQQGILTPSTKTRLEALEQQKEDLNIAIMQAQLDKPKYTKELIVQFIQQFKHGDVSNRDYQRRIIDTFVNAIYLFDDRLVITYNFKGGSQTSTIQEIEAAFGSDLTSCAPELGEYTFPEIVVQVHHYMKAHINRQELQSIITRNVRAQNMKLIQIMPAPLKNIGVNLSYHIKGSRPYSTTFTNPGRFVVSPEMEPYIQHIEVILGQSYTPKVNCASVSFGNQMDITFASTVKETDIQRDFFRHLVGEGISVKVVSNQRR